MSLQKQTVTVPLIDGISEQDDAFAHDPPGFVELAEVRWNRDKQMGKRHGVADQTGKGGAQPLAVSGLKGGNAIVDLDGVPHVLSADGTARRVPTEGDWNRMSRCAPRPGRVVVDPVVRMNGSSVKPDVAISGDLACVVWEQVDQNSGNAGAYYQFFDVSEDVPRPCCPITALTTIVCNPRVTTIGSVFIVCGISATTGARSLYGCAYDTALGTFAFAAPVSIDTVTSGSNLFALGPSYTGASFCYVAYYTGAANYFVVKLDTSIATLASKNLGAGGLGTPAQVLHNGPLSKAVVIQTDGTVKHVADSLTGAATVVSPFSAPASGAYAGKWQRAAIGLDGTTGKMVAIRSTASVGALGEPVGTQLLSLSTAFAASKEKLIGGVCLAALCSPLFSATGVSYFGLTGPQAWYTGDYDPTVPGSVNGAVRSEPYALICQTVDATSELQVATVARIGHDALDLLGNGAVGAAQVLASGTAAALSSIALDPTAVRGEQRMLTAYPARLGDNVGAWGLKRGVDLARVEIVDTTPARNVSAQSLRIIGTSHGTSAIDGVMHAEMTPQPAEWLQVNGFDSASTGNFYPFTGSVPPDFQGHINFSGYPWPGANPNRQWGFVVVWRYVDQHGNVHRSAPSSIAWCMYADLGGDGTKLNFYDWKAHALQGDVGVTPEVEVYGCPPDGDGDFRLLGIVTPKADATMEGRVFVTIVSTGNMVPNGVNVKVWDNGIGSAAGITPVPRSLYTGDFGGNELPSSVSPALLSICSTQSRLWGLNAEDRLDVWYTKPIAAGFAPEWSDTLRVRVPQDGGQAVAIAAIDDKVIVFKRSRIFMIEGEGGDASGNGSSLRTPRLISSDVGCDSVESVVEGPVGVIFHSQRGFMVLSRDLSYQFVGDRVIDQLTTDADDDEARVVRSACLVPAEAEVRFLLDSPREPGAWRRGLVWNYRFQRWTRRDALAGAFNALVGDDEWWMVEGVTAGGSNVVYREVRLDWSTSPYGIDCKTSWLKLNGIAGYARVRRATFVLRWYSGGIRILTAQDYQDATETARDWTAAEMVAQLSGGSRRVELVVHPLVQKCEAIQFQIVEQGASGGAAESGRGFELVGVTLEVGVYPGAFRRLGTGARK